jgi:hypothetical protein
MEGFACRCCSVIKGNENCPSVWYPKLCKDESIQNYDFAGY